ncbi:hypothetical protein EMIT019CA3_220008 [Bacillus pseudomycoides]
MKLDLVKRWQCVMDLDKELLIEIIKSINLEALGEWIDLCAEASKK